MSKVASMTRYYAHSLHYMMKLMKDPAVLLEDGTTDGGCRFVPIYQLNSTACPSHKESLAPYLTSWTADEHFCLQRTYADTDLGAMVDTPDIAPGSFCTVLGEESYMIAMTPQKEVGVQNRIEVHF